MVDERRSPHSSRGPLRKLIFAVVATILGLALLEGVATFFWTGVELYSMWSTAPRVEELKEEFHCAYDSEIGWINVPEKSLPDFYGPGASITIDQNGFRSHAALADVRREDATKVVCLGDSFTLGYGVDDRQTYPFQLEQRSAGTLQVFNMGQGGYSVGQDWQWLQRQMPDLKPDLVVGVFIREDFQRLGVVRTANGYGVPQFVVEDERVQVQGTPVPEKLEAGKALVRAGQVSQTLSRNSAIAKTFVRFLANEGEESDDEKLVTGLYVIRELHRLCKRNDCEFVLVLTPTLRDAHDAEVKASYRNVEQILANFAAAEGIPFKSLLQAFDIPGGQKLFLTEQFHHYSAAGNQQVAEQLLQWLPTVSRVAAE